MAHVDGVTALEICNPVAVLIEMERDDVSQHVLRLRRPRWRTR
jgi:hypothetical protein